VTTAVYRREGDPYYVVFVDLEEGLRMNSCVEVAPAEEVEVGARVTHWHRNISQMPDLTVSAAAESWPRAYAMAGAGPEDVDVAMLYDAFTTNTVLFLEDLGFCKNGEGPSSRGVRSHQEESSP
jgi:acetyl-CoA acetyltransferase